MKQGFKLWKRQIFSRSCFSTLSNGLKDSSKEKLSPTCIPIHAPHFGESVSEGELVYQIPPYSNVK